MSTSYRDRWIECTPDALLVRGYYPPWGTKRISCRSTLGPARRDRRLHRTGTDLGDGESALLGDPGPAAPT
jgi:hypothetical protein